MSDELTRLLAETLRSRGADVESMSDLTARVLRKGRSARSRRLALGWGTTSVVAAAAVVAVALLGPGGQQRSNPGPARGGTPSPTASSSAMVRETSPDDAQMTYALKLPLGPPIALVPRVEKRGTAVVVVTADHVVTLPAHTGSARHLTTSAEGLLVSAVSEGVVGVPDPDQALYLIRPDGSLTRLHKGPFDGLAVDPTGKELRHRRERRARRTHGNSCPHHHCLAVGAGQDGQSHRTRRRDQPAGLDHPGVADVRRQPDLAVETWGELNNRDPRRELRVRHAHGSGSAAGRDRPAGRRVLPSPVHTQQPADGPRADVRRG